MSIGQSQSEQFAALLSNVENASVWLQRGIAERLAQMEHINDSQEIANQVNGVLAAMPLGNDAMVATPQGLELANDLAIARTEQQQGRSSYDEHDLGLLKARVENRVKELMAAGKSRDEIIAEIGELGGANAELAQQIAKEQYEANKNPFEMPKSEQAAQQRSEGALAIASLLGFAAAKEEPAQELPIGAASLGLSADKGLQNLMLGANHAPEVEAVAATKENPHNPFAALLNGTGIIENLTKSFNDTSTPEQQAQTGQSQGRDGWAR